MQAPRPARQVAQVTARAKMWLAYAGLVFYAVVVAFTLLGWLDGR